MDDRREGFMPPMKRYVRAIEQRLDLPRDIKVRVISDLITTISARREEGEDDETIRVSLGSPKKVAAELNEEMSEFRFRRSPWRFAFIAVAALALIWFLTSVLPYMYYDAMAELSGVSIIGGADGPTAILVATEIGTGGLWFRAMAAFVLVGVGIFGYFKLKRCRNKTEE